MNKLLPHLPLLVLVFGLLVVQLENHSATAPLLSNTLSPQSGEKSVDICTKPEKFSKREESAWCNIGLVRDIKSESNDWSWSCIVGEKTHTCYFTENNNYKTRGGILFKK